MPHLGHLVAAEWIVCVWVGISGSSDWHVEGIVPAHLKATLRHLRSNMFTSIPISILLGKKFNCAAAYVASFLGEEKNQWVISLLTGTETHKAFPFSLLCLWHLLTYTWQFNVAENVQRKIAAPDREGGKGPGSRTGWEARFKSLKLERFIYFILTSHFFLKPFLKGNPIWDKPCISWQAFCPHLLSTELLILFSWRKASYCAHTPCQDLICIANSPFGNIHNLLLRSVGFVYKCPRGRPVFIALRCWRIRVWIHFRLILKLRILTIAVFLICWRQWNVWWG